MWQSSASVLCDVPLVMKVVEGHSELHCPHRFSSSNPWGFYSLSNPPHKYLCHPHSQTSGSVLRHHDNNLQTAIFLLLASLSFSWRMAARRCHVLACPPSQWDHCFPCFCSVEGKPPSPSRACCKLWQQITLCWALTQFWDLSIGKMKHLMRE